MTEKHLQPIRAGNDYALTIRYPVGEDVTGFKFYLTLKSHFEDTDAQAVLQHEHVAGSGAFDDAANGVVFFSIPASVTAGLPKGSYFYDLVAVSTQNVVTTLAPPKDEYTTKLKVIPTVTRLND